MKVGGMNWRRKINKQVKKCLQDVRSDRFRRNQKKEECYKIKREKRERKGRERTGWEG